MKNPWTRYLSIIAAILLLPSCKQGSEGSKQTNDVYQHAAVKAVTAEIENNPKNARLYYERGNILKKLQEDSLALNDFKKAVTLDSSKAEYYSAIGDLLFDHKDVSGSVQWLQKAIQLNPKDPRAHLKIAKMLMYMKDYTKAFSEINLVLRQDVYNPEGYFLKGMIYKDLKDTAKAISSFQTAVQVSPDYREAVIQLGLLYSAQKDPLALKYFDNAFRLDTLDVFPLYARGIFYQDQQLYEQAKVEYTNCIIHNPDYPDAYFNIGWILMQQDSLDKALRQYDLVTRIDPANPDAYYNRGLCYELTGKRTEAIADYKQALTFREDYPEATQGIKRLSAK